MMSWMSPPESIVAMLGRISLARRTLLQAMPAARRALAVPEVPTSSKPMPTRSRATPMIARLSRSRTEMNTRPFVGRP